MLTLSQVGALVGGYETGLYRQETLECYRAASDGGDVERYLNGERAPDPARKEPWLARLRQEQLDGKLRQRVHVLRSPVGGYLRYECEWGYQHNAVAGEDIRILDLAERPCPPGLPGHDFYVIDGSQAVQMYYDPEGRFLGAVLAGDDLLPFYLAARDAALAAAEPFTSWWARHPEYYQLNCAQAA